MTSKQMDALQQMGEAIDAFGHAFGQDYPAQAGVVERFGEGLKTWADGDPVPELKPMSEGDGLGNGDPAHMTIPTKKKPELKP